MRPLKRIVSTASILFTFSVMLICRFEPLHAQDKNDPEGNAAFINWVKGHALPLDDGSPLPVDGIIGGASVVALGEPAHGFHQSLALRNQMFRYLVEHLGFTTIVLETNFAKTRIAADFIAGGNVTVEQAAQALTIGTPTDEDMQLLRWMREYNQQPNHPVKTKFYGMDIEMVGFPGDTVPSHPAVDEILHYLEKVDHKTKAHFSKILAPFLSQLSVANYPRLSEEQHHQLSAILDQLIATFRLNRSQYIKTSTVSAFEWAYQNTVAARQTDHMVRLLPPEVPGKIPPDAWHALSTRDSAMAENVRWVLAREKKVFVYAHNAHIKNAPTAGSVWDALQRPPNSTGQYLRKALGNKLVIFGVSFDPAFDIKQTRSLESSLAKVGMTNFILDLKAAQTDQEATQWLNEVRPMQANVINYFNLSLNTAFDAIIYLGKASPALRIKPKK